MKFCGKCGYWGGKCFINPNPVGGRTEESIGCKFHNGPDEPIDGQLSFPADPVFLLNLCRSCEGDPSGDSCGFEVTLGADSNEPEGLFCTKFRRIAEPPIPGSLCSRCDIDPSNGGECERDGVNKDTDECKEFVIAEGAWPCGECAVTLGVMPDGLEVECQLDNDGLCENFVQVSLPDDDDINQLCKSCAPFKGNDVGGICLGKTDGSVECEDYMEMPEPSPDSADEAEAAESGDAS
ncbi:MAG: hypothetical protein M1455_06310 [Actinobacteria bacterium]|nr:hypothetical protein [Actinomycetota bacterium]